MPLRRAPTVERRKGGGSVSLYVVTGAGTDEPKLHRIQDPGAHFREGEDIFATGFIVHDEAWRQRAGGDEHAVRQSLSEKDKGHQ